MAPWNESMSPDDGAAWWLARERRGPLDATQLETRASWLAADPRNEAAFVRTRAVIAQIGTASSSPGMQAMLDAARRKAAVGQAANDVRPIMSRVAASVFLLAAGVAALLVIERAEIASNFADDGTIYRTALGERSSVILPDGSQLSLNTGSRVRIAFTDAQRTVELLQGEALFDVVHDSSRPFVVMADTHKITAVGTAFDVRLPTDGEALHVVMLEGRVVVDPIGAPAGFPAGRAEVVAGEQFVAVRGAVPRVQPANAARLTAWRDGRLMFDNVELAELVREANRYSATKLVVHDAQLAKLKVSGVFRVGRPQTIADALSGYFPVEYREQNGQILLLPRAVAPAQK